MSSLQELSYHCTMWEDLQSKEHSQETETPTSSYRRESIPLGQCGKKASWLRLKDCSSYIYLYKIIKFWFIWGASKPLYFNSKIRIYSAPSNSVGPELTHTTGQCGKIFSQEGNLSYPLPFLHRSRARLAMHSVFIQERTRSHTTMSMWEEILLVSGLSNPLNCHK